MEVMSVTETKNEADQAVILQDSSSSLTFVSRYLNEIAVSASMFLGQ